MISRSRLDAAVAAFKTVSVAVRDDVLETALLAALSAADTTVETLPMPVAPYRYNSLGEPLLEELSAKPEDCGSSPLDGAGSRGDEIIDGAHEATTG